MTQPFLVRRLPPSQPPPGGLERAIADGGRRRRSAVSAVCAASLLVTGSALWLTDRGSDTLVARQGDPAGDMTNAEDLSGRTFVAAAWETGGQERELVPGTELRVQFSDGQRRTLTWSAGCNVHGLPYVLSEGRLELRRRQQAGP